MYLVTRISDWGHTGIAPLCELHFEMWPFGEIPGTKRVIEITRPRDLVHEPLPGAEGQQGGALLPLNEGSHLDEILVTTVEMCSVGVGLEIITRR